MRSQDHTLSAWVIENGCIFTLAWLRSKLVFGFRDSVVKTWLANMLGGMLVIEGSIAAQKVLIDRVYAHRPFFNEKRPTPSTADCLWDWLQANCATHAVAASMFSYFTVHVMTDEMYAKAQMKGKFRLLPFLPKLGVVRVVADATFYAVHYLLHTKPLYGWVHKKHHEHYTTVLATNFHFTFADLLLEGFVPLFAGMRALSAMGVKLVALEVYLIVCYIQWYEIGSHSGKAMPTVSYFPPLAPLYKWVLGDVDANNVEFHDKHHRFLKCNYGITQWIDCLLGTARR